MGVLQPWWIKASFLGQALEMILDEKLHLTHLIPCFRVLG
jgi:hypothetical protein